MVTSGGMTAGPQGTPPTGINWAVVVLALGVAVVVIFGAFAARSVRDQPHVAAPAVVHASVTEEAPAEEPTLSARPAPRSILSGDAEAARRIAAVTGEARDALLCAIEAQTDPTATFGLLDRNPQRFLGHMWAFTGRTVQVEDVPGESGSFALISLDSYGQEVVAVFTHLRPPDSVVADRRVRVYARIAGTYSYEARNGDQRTVPKVAAVAMLRDNEVPRCRRRR